MESTMEMITVKVKRDDIFTLIKRLVDNSAETHFDYDRKTKVCTMLYYNGIKASWTTDETTIMVIDTKHNIKYEVEN